MDNKLTYAAIVKNRQELTTRDERYATLGEAGLDGFWVSPPQMTSRSRSGPVFVAYNFLDFERAIKRQQCILYAGGYLPCAQFNLKLDDVLKRAGITRSDIYITQALHFLPKENSPRDPPRDLLRRSFCKVTWHELRDRRVIAFGKWAKKMCCEWKSDFELLGCFPHISSPHFDKIQKHRLVTLLKNAAPDCVRSKERGIKLW